MSRDQANSIASNTNIDQLAARAMTRIRASVAVATTLVVSACILTMGLTNSTLANAPDHGADHADDRGSDHAPAKSVPTSERKLDMHAPATLVRAASPSAKAPASTSAPANPSGAKRPPQNNTPNSSSNTPSNNSTNNTSSANSASATSINASSPEPTTNSGPINADQAMALLAEGNARWFADKERNPNTSPERRTQAANGQTPFVSVLTCADSRIPIERVFDRGVGDVFVVRVAGNVAGESETGTLEYGVGHLKTPLLVVMGHTKCGAVAAAASGKQLHGALGGLVRHILPAVERAKQQKPDASQEEITSLAIRENVWQTIYNLYSKSTELREKAVAGDVRVVGALYDIATGKVEWIGEHPWQREIISALDAANPAANPSGGSETKSVVADANNMKKSSPESAAKVQLPFNKSAMKAEPKGLPKLDLKAGSKPEPAADSHGDAHADAADDAHAPSSGGHP